MKVLIVNGSASQNGSTGQIAYGLLNYLHKQGHSVLFCHSGVEKNIPSDKELVGLNTFVDSAISYVLTKLVGYEGRYNWRATWKLIRIIKKYQPDIVQLYNLHGFYLNHYKLLDFLKKRQIATVYSMLDEFAYLGTCYFSSTFPLYCNKFKTECKDCPAKNKGYTNSYFRDHSNRVFNRKKNIYKGFNSIVFTGPSFVCKQASISALLKGKRIIELEEPIDYDSVFFPHESLSLRKELHIPNENLVVLTVANASFERKGGKYVLELARQMEERKDITFVYVGYNRSDWDIPSNMIAVGFISSQDLLAQYYSMADLFVCTSLGDTTPNTCLAALGCGTPLTGFKEGGVPYCAKEPYGRFVDTFDLEGLVNIVKNTSPKTDQWISEIRNYAISRYSSEVVYKKQVDIYCSLIK